MPGLLFLAMLLSADDVALRSSRPAFELPLPAGYQSTIPRETPTRWTRSCGRETWATVSLTLSESTQMLAQNRAGISLADLVPYLGLPPEAKSTFRTMPWRDVEIGVVEYRAVVKDLPVIGICAVVPLMAGTVTATVYAPDPLEKECREDFEQIVSRLAKAPTPWHPPEYYRKIQRIERIGQAGIGLFALYPIAWLALFRGDPMRAHVLRTIWLFAAALALFIPITSPGETTLYSNLVVNGIAPLAVLAFAIRRIKLAFEMD